MRCSCRRCRSRACTRRNARKRWSSRKYLKEGKQKLSCRSYRDRAITRYWPGTRSGTGRTCRHTSTRDRYSSKHSSCPTVETSVSGQCCCVQQIRCCRLRLEVGNRLKTNFERLHSLAKRLQRCFDVAEASAALIQQNSAQRRTPFVSCAASTRHSCHALCCKRDTQPFVVK